MSTIRLPRLLTHILSRLHSAPRAEMRMVLAVTLCLFLLLVATAPVLAGPGGQFAKVVAKTWLGKIVLAILFVVLLPVVLWALVREWVGVRKTRRDLAELATTHDYFDWAQIEARVEEAAAGVGHAWGTGNLDVVADYFTEDYLASQQALLERWRLEGKKNVHEFHDINKIKPLFVRTGGGWWQDQVSVLISATVVDYLQDTETGKVLKGKKRKDRNYETIWNLVRERGAWRLSSIEEGSESLNLAMQANRVKPAAALQPGWPSQLPATQVAEDFRPAQDEQTVVEVAGDDHAERDPGQVAQRREEQR